VPRYADYHIRKSFLAFSARDESRPLDCFIDNVILPYNMRDRPAMSIPMPLRH